MTTKKLNLLLLISVFYMFLFTSCSSSSVATSKGKYEVEENSTIRDELVNEARKWLGAKYKYGGHSKNGTDCSGMVMEVYLAVCDYKLPRSSKEQQEFCKKIDKDELRKGDLVFFVTGKNKKRVSHVGLYIGGDDFIHSSSSKGVIISSLNQNYYKRTYHSSGRVEGVKFKD
ncbi:MAG: NlpC/P60 family protein [Bacteroidales bacterium]|nr:NlpC/P60 family protein [Bacteroidales bacterium]